MTEYQEKLLDPRWQKKRLKVLERDNWACACCRRNDNTLHVHHLVYSRGEPWDAPDNTLESLCADCHDWRTSFNALFGKGLMPTLKCRIFFNCFSCAFDDRCTEAFNFTTLVELTRITSAFRVKELELAAHRQVQQSVRALGEIQNRAPELPPVSGEG